MSKYSIVMFIFNLIPVFPLDGYRILSNLINNYLYEELYIYFGIFLLIVIIFISFIFKIYAFIIISIYLIFVNILKLKELYIIKKINRIHVLSYILSK